MRLRNAIVCQPCLAGNVIIVKCLLSLFVEVVCYGNVVVIVMKMIANHSRQQQCHLNHSMKLRVFIPVIGKAHLLRCREDAHLLNSTWKPRNHLVSIFHLGKAIEA